MSKRLFIALELPESVKTTLAGLDPALPGVRWLPPAQMHLTLAFLEQVPEPEEVRLMEAIAAIRVPPFFLPVQGAGVFGGTRPAVVWAGVGKGHPHLFALHKHVQDAVLHAGMEPDLRPFHPHITIGRAKGVSSAALLPFLREHANAELGMWHVESLTLFSSVLSPKGATHRVEMRQAL